VINTPFGLPLGKDVRNPAPPDADDLLPYCQGEAPVRFSEYVGGFVY